MHLGEAVAVFVTTQLVIGWLVGIGLGLFATDRAEAVMKAGPQRPMYLMLYETACAQGIIVGGIVGALIGKG